MNPHLGWGLEHPDLLVGVVVADGVRVEPSSAALTEEIAAAVAARAEAEWPPEELRRAIRRLLRHGGFKPSGRSKPASEYLAAAARRGEFPLVYNVVDINNLISLSTGWPASVLDTDRLLPDGAGALELRLGVAGERYVFNSVGHTIDLRGLLCVARQGGPCLANPVKDSLEAKVDEASSRLLAVIYTSRKVAGPDEVEAACRRYGDLLRDHAGATTCRWWVLPDGGQGCAPL